MLRHGFYPPEAQQEGQILSPNPSTPGGALHRRAYIEQRWPIKEIVRRLAVSRATVRRVIRSQKTEFKYERGVQPVPKLGEWVAALSEMLEKEAKLPRRERRWSRPSTWWNL
jgi:hypothetical protein